MSRSPRPDRLVGWPWAGRGPDAGLARFRVRSPPSAPDRSARGP